MINNKNTLTLIERKEKRTICLYLFIFAIIVRAIYYIGFMNNPFFDFINPASDQINFDNAAIGFANGSILAEGGGESYAPLYKYFIGFIYWIFGRNFYAVWAIQFIVGAIGSVLMFLITIRFFNKKVAIICSIIFALYGPNLFYEGNLLRASLTEFLAIVLFYYLLRYKEETRLKYIILSATFLSLLIQCRPNNLTLVPFVFYFIYSIVHSLPTKTKIKQIIIFLAVLVVVGIPLMARTVAVHKKFVFYDTSGDYAFLYGNLPEYVGVGWDNRYYTSKVTNIINKTSEANVSVYSYVLKNIMKFPLDYLKLYCRKTYWFFNNYEFPSNGNYYLYQHFSLILKNPTGNFAILFALTIVGIAITYKNYKRYLIIYFFLAGLTLSVIIVYPVSRFRMPIVPFFMIFASYTIYYIFQKIYQRKSKTCLFSILSVAIVAYLLKTPGGSFYKIRPVDYSNMSFSYMKNKNKYDLSKSTQFLQKSWNLNSTINRQYMEIYNKQKSEGKKTKRRLLETVSLDFLSKAYNAMAYNSFRKGELKETINYANKILEINYEDLGVQKLLGASYLQAGDYLNAINIFKKCIMVKPEDADNYFNLIIALNKSKKNNNEAIYYSLKALSIDPNIFKDKNWYEKEIKKNSTKLKDTIIKNRDTLTRLSETIKEAINANQFEIAASNCKKFIDIDYSNIDAHNYLAYSYSQLGQLENSISEYINILTIDPTNAEVHHNLYKLYKTSEANYLKAMYHLKICIALNPDEYNNETLRKGLHYLQFWADNLRQIGLGDELTKMEESNEK